MPYNLGFVRNKAREQAEMRGHVLGTFTNHGKDASSALCMRCNLGVVCFVDPEKLNDIGGEAIRTVCNNRGSFLEYNQ